MVETTIRTVDQNISFKAVHASRGKITRAEPIAALSEQHRILFVGSFPELEDQLCTFAAGSSSSPDRLDAMVWAFTELMIDRPGNTGFIDFYAAQVRESVRSEVSIIPAVPPSGSNEDHLFGGGDVSSAKRYKSEVPCPPKPPNMLRHQPSPRMPRFGDDFVTRGTHFNVRFGDLLTSIGQHES